MKYEAGMIFKGFSKNNNATFYRINKVIMYDYKHTVITYEYFFIINNDGIFDNFQASCTEDGDNCIFNTLIPLDEVPIINNKKFNWDVGCWEKINENELDKIFDEPLTMLKELNIRGN